MSAAPAGDTGGDGDVAGRLLIALARLSRTLRREVPAGLGHGSVSALATVARDGPLRPGDLAAREGVGPPTMTRILAGLEAEGYVTRSTDPADRRAWLVRATPQGERLVHGASNARAQLLADRIAGLTPQQRQALLAALPVLESLSTDPVPAR